jgi:hypothetical protein
MWYNLDVLDAIYFSDNCGVLDVIHSQRASEQMDALHPHLKIKTHNIYISTIVC